MIIIKKDHSKESEEACEKMLLLWYESDANASWDQLIKTLKAPHINKTPLANEIKQMLKSDGMFRINN